MGKEKYQRKTIVLKKHMDDDDARKIIEEKKTTIFRKLLRKPKRDEVLIHSLELYYEAILMISGKYTADYFRKATHSISVDYNVGEIVLGEGVFKIKKKSSIAKSLAKKSKNKVELPLEEHVFIDEEGEMAFDHHGKEIRFQYKINSKAIENFPNNVLKDPRVHVRESELTHIAVIKKLESKLKESLDSAIRNLTDELIINKITEIYVPIFEARLVGPEKKAGIMRIDAVRKKIL
ncbi:MAG: hypothetical protein ACE5EJ_02025 [Nitrosopumilaceae archaeon]